jgi:hypothetical protein
MIYSLVVPVGRCSERNPQGTATQGHYVVENDQVILTDEEGHKTSGRAALNGQGHRTVAARLILRRWQDERRNSKIPNGFGSGELLEYDHWKY